MRFEINKAVRIYGDQKAGDKIPPGSTAEYHPWEAGKVEIADEGWGEFPPTKDTYFADKATRSRHDAAPDFGHLIISIQPGDECIGELYFNVQYEGPNRPPREPGEVEERDRCLDGLNVALPDVRAWIIELLTDTTDAQIDGKESAFEIQIDSYPCPKSHHRIAVERLMKAEVLRTEPVEIAVGLPRALTREIKG